MIKIVLILFLCLSALMVWEAFWHAAFDLVVRQPLRDWVEDSYLLVVPGSFIYLGLAVYRLVRSRYTLRDAIIRVVLTALWCVTVLLCCVLISVRAAI